MNCQKKNTVKQTFAIDLRNDDLTAEDLLSTARRMYPPCVGYPFEWDEPYPDPLYATAVVLMSAALIGTTNAVLLEEFTGYRREFITAIKFNMKNSHLWSDGQYDASAWLSSKGAIDPDRLYDDAQVALGFCWMPDADSDDPTDACGVYCEEWRYPAVGTIRAQMKKGARR